MFSKYNVHNHHVHNLFWHVTILTVANSTNSIWVKFYFTCIAVDRPQIGNAQDKDDSKKSTQIRFYDPVNLCPCPSDASIDLRSGVKVNSKLALKVAEQWLSLCCRSKLSQSMCRLLASHIFIQIHSFNLNTKLPGSSKLIPECIRSCVSLFEFDCVLLRLDRKRTITFIFRYYVTYGK